ncbi:MAG: hypothetical protein ACKVPJ_05225 [Chitinophagales bacterium]
MTTEQIINWGKDNPKKVFLVDCVGAILSAFLLGIVLVQLERIFGIPKPTLYFLATLPCLFAMYDLYCYFKISKKPGLFLKGIAIANLLYGVLSIGLAIYHCNTITQWGWAYIIGEIMIVTAIAVFEWNVANRLMTKYSL